MALDNSLKEFAMDELKKLVRIPSISFKGFDPKQVEKSAEAVAELLKRTGFRNVECSSIDGCRPYVTGDYIVSDQLPTLLLYAHHDVQPVGNEEIWKSPPFEPTEKDGRLYGRGTADDKAGAMVHIAALKHFLDRGEEPPVNLKVVIEGEEETGSAHLLDFLKQNFDRLKADAIIVTDTANIESGVPSLTVSLRGMVVCEVVVSSMESSLHSGMWGGGVVDPVSVLVKMLSKLTDEDGNILLESVKKRGSKDYSHIPVTREAFGKQAGVFKESAVYENFFHRVWNESDFAINAIQASSEKNANNIICNRAYARVGIRIAAGESAEEVQTELVQKIRELAPDSVDLELRSGPPVDAWSIDPKAEKNRFAFDAATRALERAYDKPAVLIGCGATIPFIAPFEEAMKAPVITLGIEDPYTLAHSENESLLISDFYKTIEAEIELFKEWAKP